MKKPKLRLGPGGLKGLFVRHIEKMVFGVSLLLVILFFAMGLRLQSDLGDETPPKLEALANNAVAHVKVETADVIKEERVPRDGKGGQYELRVVNREAMTPTVYETVMPWKTPLGNPGVKREDPEVFPPIKLETTTFTGAICLKNDDGLEGLLAELENAPAKKEKRSSKKRSSRGMADMYGDEADYGDMGEGYGEAMYGGPTRGKKRSSRDRKKKDDRPKPPERTYDASKVCGYRPSGRAGGGGGYGADMASAMASQYGASSMGPYGASATRGPTDPLAKTQHVIAVKALVPYRKQADEFKRVLGSAVGYDPNRDNPRVVFFQAQRVDVTDDPNKELAESDWKDMMNPKRAADAAKKGKWHGFLQEVADRTYVDPAVTMPAPPMMLCCMDDAMLHSEVPKMTMVSPLDKLKSKEEEETEESLDDMPGGADLPGGMPFGGRRGSRGFPGAGYPGAGGGYPGAAYGGGEPDYGYGEEEDYGYGEEADYGEGYGSPYGGGSPYGSPYGMGRPTAEPAQYKLIRFFDTKVQPGRLYRYRIRLFVEDPNNPNADPMNGPVLGAPSRRTLSMKVLARLKKIEDSDAETKPYYVITDWSEACDPVSLSSTSRAFAGTAAAARYSNSADGGKIEQNEVSGTMVPVVWNDALAIDVSKELKVYRGSVLNASGQFDVIDPVTLAVKMLKSYDLESQWTVIDISGGDDLPGDRQDKVTSVAEFLLIDEKGNFHFQNELDDYDRYRRYTLADEIQKTISSSSYEGEGGGELTDEYDEGYEGY